VSDEQPEQKSDVRWLVGIVTYWALILAAVALAISVYRLAGSHETTYLAVKRVRQDGEYVIVTLGPRTATVLRDGTWIHASGKWMLRGQFAVLVVLTAAFYVWTRKKVAGSVRETRGGYDEPAASSETTAP
jgi:hypothetical protein